MDEVWEEYEAREKTCYRFLRVVLVASIYWVFCRVIFALLGYPLTPARGVISARINHGVMMLSTICFITLIFYVFDATRSFRIFVNNVYDRIPVWSQSSLQHFAPGCETDPAPPITEFMLIKLIAARTDAVGRLIYYPFLVWSLIILSRSHYFDNWHFNRSLIVVFTMSGMLTWLSAVSLRHAAEDARDKAIQRLRKRMLIDCEMDDKGMKRIALVIDEIRAIREGAFVPFMQRPAVQALLLPFSGVGGAYLFDILEKMTF